MKKTVLSVLMVLWIAAAGCAEKYAELNAVKDLSLFGSTPEKAGELLGIDFSAVVPEEEEEGEPAADIYRMPEKYLIGGYPAEMEFRFYKSETPKGTPVGLAAVIMYFEPDIDMKKLSRDIGTACELEGSFSYGKDDNEEVDFFSWIPVTTEERKELPLEEAVRRTPGIGGVSERSPYFSITGDRIHEDYVIVYVVGALGALKNHIEDYR